MSKYPNITDTNFYSKINSIYKKYKVPSKKSSMASFCMPKKYSLQLPQQFLSEFMSSNTPYNGILVYHRIGAGKTCTAIRIAEKWKNKKKIIVVVPASLKGNFRNELRSQCAENNYLTEKERKKLSELHPSDPEFKEIIIDSDKRIDKYYNIYSYNKFIELLNDKKINFNNTLLIIDEVQNMVSEEGSYYETLYKAIKKSPSSLRIVLLSATPMFDKPHEIGLTMNLLKLKEEFPIGKEFEKTFINKIKKSNGSIEYKVINMDLFKKLIKGYISYFRGAPPNTFPRMTIKYIECEMGQFQDDAYKRVLKREEKDLAGIEGPKKLFKNLNVSDLPNNFYIGTRFVSNIVFPNTKINEEGYKSFTPDKIKKNLKKYSIKFKAIMDKIESSTGKIFIYSSFKEFGGIKSFIKVLNAYGYKDYIRDGDGSKRYAIWSGDEKISVKEQIRAVFNMNENITGQKIKILLGSPSIKEGVSLKAVRQVHILEPYWNKSRIEQVIGRASRFCSHKDLPEEKRNVKVYIYIAVPYGYGRKKNLELTIDQRIQELSIRKEKIIRIFEKMIKESAVDCELNKNANVYKGEENIKCNK